MAVANRKCSYLFVIFGKVGQSLFPRKDIVSIPYVVVCTFGSCVSLPCLKLTQVFRSAKISFMKGGLKPDFVLRFFASIDPNKDDATRSKLIISYPLAIT